MYFPTVSIFRSILRESGERMRMERWQEGLIKEQANIDNYATKAVIRKDNLFMHTPIARICSGSR